MPTRSQIRQRVANMAQTALNASSYERLNNCVNAFNYKPPNIADADLPVVWTQRGRSRYAEGKFGTYSFEDQNNLELCEAIAQTTSGLIGEAEQQADLVFEVWQEYLGSHYRTSHDGTATGIVIEITLTGDQGVRGVRFDKVLYYTAIMNVIVAYERTIDYTGI